MLLSFFISSHKSEVYLYIFIFSFQTMYILFQYYVEYIQ